MAWNIHYTTITEKHCTNLFIYLFLSYFIFIYLFIYLLGVCVVCRGFLNTLQIKICAKCQDIIPAVVNLVGKAKAGLSGS